MAGPLRIEYPDACVILMGYTYKDLIACMGMVDIYFEADINPCSLMQVGISCSLFGIFEELSNADISNHLITPGAAMKHIGYNQNMGMDCQRIGY